MDKKILDYELRSSEAFLLQVATIFGETEGNTTPLEGGFTIAQQLAHCAQTVHWFIGGATQPEGFSMDFQAHRDAVMKVTSLEDAKAQVHDAYKAMRAWLANSSEAELASPLPEGPVMGGVPKLACVLAIVDHTAHHRGMLSAYARAMGKTPPMPYEAQVPFEA